MWKNFFSSSKNPDTNNKKNSVVTTSSSSSGQAPQSAETSHNNLSVSASSSSSGKTQSAEKKTPEEIILAWDEAILEIDLTSLGKELIKVDKGRLLIERILDKYDEIYAAAQTDKFIKILNHLINAYKSTTEKPKDTLENLLKYLAAFLKDDERKNQLAGLITKLFPDAINDNNEVAQIAAPIVTAPAASAVAQSEQISNGTPSLKTPVSNAANDSNSRSSSYSGSNSDDDANKSGSKQPVRERLVAKEITPRSHDDGESESMAAESTQQLNGNLMTTTVAALPAASLPYTHSSPPEVIIAAVEKRAEHFVQERDFSPTNAASASYSPSAVVADAASDANDLKLAGAAEVNSPFIQEIDHAAIAAMTSSKVVTKTATVIAPQTAVPFVPPAPAQRPVPQATLEFTGVSDTRTDTESDHGVEMPTTATAVTPTKTSPDKDQGQQKSASLSSSSRVVIPSLADKFSATGIAAKSASPPNTRSSESPYKYDKRGSSLNLSSNSAVTLSTAEPVASSTVLPNGLKRTSSKSQAGGTGSLNASNNAALPLASAGMPELRISSSATMSATLLSSAVKTLVADDDEEKPQMAPPPPLGAPPPLLAVTNNELPQSGANDVRDPAEEKKESGNKKERKKSSKRSESSPSSSSSSRRSDGRTGTASETKRNLKRSDSHHRDESVSIPKKSSGSSGDSPDDDESESLSTASGHDEPTRSRRRHRSTSKVSTDKNHRRRRKHRVDQDDDASQSDSTASEVDLLQRTYSFNTKPPLWQRDPKSADELVKAILSHMPIAELEKKVKDPVNVLNEVITEDGKTLLHLACYHLHIDAIKMLVESGIDINAKDKEGCTALDYLNRPDKIIGRQASKYKTDEKYIAAVNLAKTFLNNYENYPFYKAVNALDYNRALSTVVVYKSLMPKTNSQKQTLLHLIASNKSNKPLQDASLVKIAQLILKNVEEDKSKNTENRAALLNAQDAAGDTALHLACRFGLLDLAIVLAGFHVKENNKANAKLRNIGGDNCLFDLIDFYNANKKIITENGDVLRKIKELIGLLLSAGAKIDDINSKRNDAGKATPVKMANGDVTLQNILKAAVAEQSLRKATQPFEDIELKDLLKKYIELQYYYAQYKVLQKNNNDSEDFAFIERYFTAASSHAQVFLGFDEAKENEYIAKIKDSVAVAPGNLVAFEQRFKDLLPTQQSSSFEATKVAAIKRMIAAFEQQTKINLLRSGKTLVQAKTRIGIILGMILKDYEKEDNIPQALKDFLKNMPEFSAYINNQTELTKASSSPVVARNAGATPPRATIISSSSSSSPTTPSQLSRSAAAAYTRSGVFGNGERSSPTASPAPNRRAPGTPQHDDEKSISPRLGSHSDSDS